MRIILACLDGSARSAGVLSAAIAVARVQRARVVLMRAIHLPADFPEDLFGGDDVLLEDALRRRTTIDLDARLLDIPPDLRAEAGTEIRTGVPWAAICSVAQQRQADLVVIGSHGYGGWDRLLGTTAGKVVNHAPCSVLVVRESMSGPAFATDQTEPGESP